MVPALLFVPDIAVLAHLNSRSAHFEIVVSEVYKKGVADSPFTVAHHLLHL